MNEIYCVVTIKESTGALIGIRTPGPDLPADCLLYTSDAADE